MNYIFLPVWVKTWSTWYYKYFVSVFPLFLKALDFMCYTVFIHLLNNYDEKLVKIAKFLYLQNNNTMFFA